MSKLLLILACFYAIAAGTASMVVCDTEYRSAFFICGAPK